MILRRILLAIGLLAAFAAHAQVAGRVLVAMGDVIALREGREEALVSGASVLEKDVILTGEASAAQIRLTDESILAIRAKSRVQLADYRFTGADDGISQVALGLLRGGLRLLTGLVGKQRRDRWSLTSPVATLGIRGTTFTVVHCDQDCLESDGAVAMDGTYGVVYDGRISVGNDGGEREFGADEAFFVSDAKTAAQPLVGRPGFLRDRLEARARRQEQLREAAQRVAEARAEAAAIRAALSPAMRETLEKANLRPVAIFGSKDTSITVANLLDSDGSVALLGPGLGAGVALTGATQGLAAVDGGRGAVVVLDGERGKLEQFSFNDGIVAGDRLGALVLDSGKIDGDGAVAWGRWTDEAGVRINGITAKPDTGVHFFFGNLTPESFFSTLSPGATAVRYEYAGGTRPTNGQAAAGTFLDGLFVVDFLQRSLAGGIRYEIGSVTYDVPVPLTPIAARQGFVGFSVSATDAGRWSCGTCGGGTGSIDAYTVSGIFLGSRAQNLGVTFATVDRDAGRSAGTSIFRCTGTGCR